jgi:hypothetical protein
MSMDGVDHMEWWRERVQWLSERVVDLSAENKQLREAIAWALEVTPAINDFGQATICLSPAEFDRMRGLAGA